LLAADDFLLSTGSSLNFAGISVGDDISITAAGNATLGALTTTGLGDDAESNRGNISLAIGGTLSASTINAHGGILANVVGDVTTGALNASTNITTNSSDGAVTLADVESLGGAVAVTAHGLMSVGNIRAAGSINLTGTAAITAGNLTAGTGPLIASGGFGGGGGGSGAGAAPAGIAPGFDDASIVRCDDCATGAVDLPFMLNFFGINRLQTFVSNNGYLTFNSGQGTFTPSGLGAGYVGQPIIAAFFADVDTRNPGSAQVTYGPGTYAGRTAFGATYQNVGYFSNQADKLNSFQIVLADRSDTGPGNFDIYYNYAGILWETGSASDGINGFGGVSAAVGFNAGTGNQVGTFFELPGSRIPGSFLNLGPQQLIAVTNNGVPGQLSFAIRNGQIAQNGAAQVPGIRVTNVGAGNLGDVQLGNLSGELVSVRSAGAVTLGNSDVGDRGSGLTSTDRLTTVIEAATSITAGNVASGGSVSMTATSGALAAGTVTSGSSLVALAGGALTFTGESSAATTASLTGSSITLSAPLSAGTDAQLQSAGTVQAPRITTGGNLTINGGLGITVPTINAGGNVDLTASNGAVLVSDDLSASGLVNATGTTVSLRSLGSLSLGTANATTGDLDVNASGTLSIGQLAMGSAIRLNSSDIVINPQAQIGALGRTTNVTLTNGGNRQTTVGGSGGTTGYGISNAELQRVFANDIFIIAPRVTEQTGAAQGSAALNSRAPDVILDTLTLTAANGQSGATAGNIGTSGRLRIETPGKLRTIGAVTLNGVGSGNRFEIQATEALELTPATGSITLQNGSALAGTLSLTSQDVIAASASAISDVASAPTVKAITDRLKINDGAVNDEGVFRANAIVVNVSNGFYVQNTGTSGSNSRDFASRRGLTVGSGGLTISTASPTTRIVINGRQLLADGTSSTGLKFIPLVSIGSTGQSSALFDVDSTINGCVIINPALCQAGFQEIAIIRDTINEIQDAEEAAGSDLLPIALVLLKEAEESGYQPVIDDPVTGSGNDDLWAVDDAGKGGAEEEEEEKRARAKAKELEPATP
jgi:hypothetical protein